MSNFQRKKRVIVVIFFFMLVIGLFTLPKASLKSPTLEEKKEDENHLHLIPTQNRKSVDKFIALFKSEKDKLQQASYLDSLCSFFEKSQILDSVAYYREQFSRLYPEKKYIIATARSYYKVSQLAIDPKRRLSWTQKALNQYNTFSIDELALFDKVNVGMLLTSGKNPMQGIEIIRRVLQEDPNHYYALQQMGILSMLSGQYKKAIERWENILTLFPNDTMAIYYLAICFRNMGQEDQAEQLIERLETLKQK